MALGRFKKKRKLHHQIGCLGSTHRLNIGSHKAGVGIPRKGNMDL